MGSTGRTTILSVESAINGMEAIHPPDIARLKRLEPVQPKHLTSVDKPIRLRVMKTRPATHRKHYPRKARRQANYDPRKVRFF